MAILGVAIAAWLLYPEYANAPTPESLQYEAEGPAPMFIGTAIGVGAGAILNKVAGAIGSKLRFCPTKGTEVVQRAMSRAELKAIQKSGLMTRGGRAGPHYVSDSVNANALRARQRLALPNTPEVRATLEVPSGVFSSPTKVTPKYNMPGGGLERTAPGSVDIPAKVLDILEY